MSSFMKYICLSFLIISFAGCSLRNNEECAAEAMQYLSKFEAVNFELKDLQVIYSSPYDLRPNFSEHQKTEIFTLINYLKKNENFGNLTCSDLDVIKANYDVLESMVSNVDSLKRIHLIRASYQADFARRIDTVLMRYD